MIHSLVKVFLLLEGSGVTECERAELGLVFSKSGVRDVELMLNVGRLVTDQVAGVRY